MKKKKIEEGVLFAVPLRCGRFSVGLVARSEGIGIIGYFFPFVLREVPSLNYLDQFSMLPEDAIRVLNASDLSLRKGKWPIIGSYKNWKRKDWPIPDFARTDPITGKASVVKYYDNYLDGVEREASSAEVVGLEKDGLYGSGAVELTLTALLGSQDTASIH